MTAAAPAPDALARLCKEHGGRVLTWAIRLGEPDWDPEALSSEALAAAIADGRQLPADPDLVPRWLFGHIQATIRRRQRGPSRWWPFGARPAPAPDRLEATGSAAALLRRRAFIQQVLSTLSGEERALVVLVEMEGLPFIEAADWLDLRPEVALASLERARRKLLPAAQAAGLTREELGGRRLVARSAAVRR